SLWRRRSDNRRCASWHLRWELLLPWSLMECSPALRWKSWAAEEIFYGSSFPLMEWEFFHSLPDCSPCMSTWDSSCQLVFPSELPLTVVGRSPIACGWKTPHCES